jgi:hypothetical protein
MIDRFARQVMGWTVLLVLVAGLSHGTVEAAGLKRAAKALDASCIDYRHHGRPLKCCECGPKIQTVLCVKNPVTCCTVLVPVCLPHCCTDLPCENSRVGLFHRGIVVYDYDCGVKVKVVFTKHGDVQVHYFGA